jgi:hypothetical protein
MLSEPHADWPAPTDAIGSRTADDARRTRDDRNDEMVAEMAATLLPTG